MIEASESSFGRMPPPRQGAFRVQAHLLSSRTGGWSRMRGVQRVIRAVF
jgi:hypothetical protein